MDLETYVFKSFDKFEKRFDKIEQLVGRLSDENIKFSMRESYVNKAFTLVATILTSTISGLIVWFFKG